MKHFVLATHLLFIFCFSCKQQDIAPEQSSSNIIVQTLRTNYELLPEEIITTNADSTIFAQYSRPTEKYTHGVFGDIIEAEGLVIYQDGRYRELILPDSLLFEDLYPRLIDVTADGIPEVICIRTHLNLGAGLVIYQIAADTLLEYAYVPEIGRRSRWLNPAAVADLDEDGSFELVWVQTPHIGGVLKVAQIEPGELLVTNEVAGVSNHGLNELNLCLSVLVERDGELQLGVPIQERDGVRFFSYTNGVLEWRSDTLFTVDFGISLEQQLTEESFLVTEVCQ